MSEDEDFDWFNSWGDDSEYDYSCGGCGKGYYADVDQWGCPHCGSCKLTGHDDKPQEVSPESYAETMIEFYVGMNSPEGLIDDEYIDLEVAKKLLNEKIEKLIHFRDIL